MTLAIGWLHEACDQPHPALRGGSMTLAIGWLHDGGETVRAWLHEGGDWQQAAKQASYEADARALASGKKSREQLSRENGVPARIARAPLSQDAWDSIFKS